METKIKIKQRGVEVAIIAAAAVCFLFLAGDDNPADPMSTAQWVSVKLLAAAALLLLIMIVRSLHRKGLLPRLN